MKKDYPDSYYIDIVEQDDRNGIYATYSTDFRERYIKALNNEIKRLEEKRRTLEEERRIINRLDEHQCEI